MFAACMIWGFKSRDMGRGFGFLFLGMVLLLGAGHAWSVDVDSRGMHPFKPPFNSLNDDGDVGRQTKDEPEEGDVNCMEGCFEAVTLVPLYYQESGGGIYLNLQSIPDEVWMMILEFLDFRDWVRFAQVSKFFLRIIQSHDVLGPREIWPYYAELSRYLSANDRFVLDQRLLDSFRDLAPRISEEHFLYFLQRMLRLGAGVGARSLLGLTPLHLAVQCGHEQAIWILVNFGADVGARSCWGKTALHLAAELGHVRIVRLLVEHGADVGVVDCQGWTPLHCAARFGHEHVIRVLVELGANLDVMDNQGRTPLRLAEAYGNMEVLGALRLDINHIEGVLELARPREVGNAKRNRHLARRLFMSVREKIRP